MAPADSVSVIIPAMNSAEYIAGAVGSALSQTHAAHEVLVVDGGSRDATQEIVRAFGGTVRLLDQREYGRKGIAAGRNMGVEAATGEWLAFLDADDWWDEGKLAAQLPALAAKPGAVLSYTAGWTVEMRSGERKPAPAASEESVWPSLRWVNSITTSAVVAHRRTLVEAGAFREDLVACEDWELWVRMRLRGPFAAVDKPLTFYRVLEGSSTSWNIENHLRALGQLDQSAVMLTGLSGWERWATRRKMWSAQLFGAALLARQLDRKRENGLLLRSLGWWPSPGFLPLRYAAAVRSVVGPQWWAKLRR